MEVFIKHETKLQQGDNRPRHISMYDFPQACSELFQFLNVPLPTNFNEYYCLMNQYDTDKNGMIDVQEFIAMVNSFSTQKYNKIENYDNHQVCKYQLPNNYLQVAKNLFFRCDADRSGYIEVREFVGLISELFLTLSQPPPNLRDCYAIMQKFDSDGNGKIDFIEYVRMVTSFEETLVNNQSGQSGNLVEKSRILFAKMNMDANGEIDMNEFPKLLNQLFKELNFTQPSMNDCQNIMKAFDKDGNGRMSIREYDDMILKIMKTIKK